MRIKLLSLLSLVALILVATFLPLEYVSSQANAPCYGLQGGAKHVAGSGCEYEFQSGSTLDIQSGTTFNNAAGMIQSGVLTVNNNLVVTGTSDLQDSVANSTGELVLGDAVSVTGIITAGDNLVVIGTSDLQGNVSDSAGELTFDDAVSVTGIITAGDNLVVLGTSDFQDDIFDSTDDLTIADNADVTGTLQFGADDNFALGYASSAQEVQCGNETVTGTTQITPSGLSTVSYAIVSLAADPGTAEGEASLVTVDPPSTQTLTINTWSITGTTTTVAVTGTTVTWCAFGDE